MNAGRPAKVALLYPGDRAMRDRPDPVQSRFAALFAAFAEAGVSAEPAVWNDHFANEVDSQLRRVDAVLVWCNPVEDGHRRDVLDALLRDIARGGVFVSTHPDTILCLGTKDVLFDTRDLPFGSDVHRIESLDQLASELPRRLDTGPRVLKQYRGHSGIGVWRVQWDDLQCRTVRLRHAQRGSEEEVVNWPVLLASLARYFEPANGGHMIDQEWQPRLSEGMVRAYLVEDRVVGFGHQTINALYPVRPGEPAVQPGPRLYHGPDDARFQDLKQRLESDWIEALRTRVGVAADRLPLLWDCDFMFGERAPSEPERYVLCEINVSSVSPFPPSAITPLVAATLARVRPRTV